MVAIKAVAHISIPVSDIPRSTRFYTEIVGCTHLSTVPGGQMAFLDAAGTCLILVKREPPVNQVLDDHGGVHHSFAVAHEDYRSALEHLRAHGVEITFEEAGRPGAGLDPVEDPTETDQTESIVPLRVRLGEGDSHRHRCRYL